MKIERLYAITMYLLNHGRTSASELAHYFEVSVRTIQRDIDSLCLSGIPVVAVSGSAGGYEISEQFKLDKQFATSEDYSYILTALGGLVSATDDRRAKQVFEKIAQMSRSENNGIILDFSVLREGEEGMLQLLQTAVRQKRVVDFAYTNNNNETRIHRVEPVAVLYRWYAWYLLAFSRVKEDYRTYKLVRMQELKLTEEPFTREHEPADVILRRADQTDTRPYISVLLKGQAEIKARAVEYLRGTVLEEYENGDFLMQFTVPENEQFWFGTVLSFGDRTEVIAPANIRKRLLENAEKIVSLYKEL